MADVNITSLDVSGDVVSISGTVDGVAVQASAWLSHLYPPKTQSAGEAARGCQSDAARKSYLANQLLSAAGFSPDQQLANQVTQALQVLVTASEPAPVVIDPTK